MLAALSVLALGLAIASGLNRWLTARQLAQAAGLPTPTLFVFPTETPTVEGPTPGPTWTPAPTGMPTHTPLPTWLGLQTSIPPAGTLTSLAGEAGDVPANPPAATPTYPPTSTPDPDAVPLDLIANLPPVRDLPEVALEVDLDYEGHRAQVEMMIAAPNTSPDVWGELVFNLPVASVLRGVALGEVTAGREGAERQPVAAVLDGITLRVPLPELIGPGEVARAEIHYLLRFAEVPASATFPVGLTGYTGTVVRAGDWYPVLAPYDAGRGWRTFRYTAVGDPALYPASNVTLAVRAPAGITVAGSEPTSEAGGVWRFRAEAARGMAWFASDQFSRVEAEANGIPVISYFLIGYSAGGEAAASLAAQALTIYEDLYGPYPYERLVVVQNWWWCRTAGAATWSSAG
jgi:hypothetical protein